MPDRISTANAASGSAARSIALWLGVLALVYLLLVGVSVVGAGLNWISGGADGAAAIFAFASNPIAGVILGTLATALVQSSSTVTSVIVGLVAGGMPVSLAGNGLRNGQRCGCRRLGGPYRGHIRAPEARSL